MAHNLRNYIFPPHYFSHKKIVHFFCELKIKHFLILFIIQLKTPNFEEMQLCFRNS